ncbi:hypothetical protein HMPREF0063_10988 [Aeromicrobium marinum DSM 15272]|uniref:Uncharacterized protein n=1 Tax=Aeromicrobium marinum DSM 15272 TaxID=585531 RepID=E2SAJ8_9ACTN|nr:hypothetical protein [Aeromicrobium marinum]EFQ84272.1 hypothetical protein HMPREF0063_10988 [Aeromicrobium marinum DSM 15272]
MTTLPDRPEERRIIIVRSPQDYEQVDFEETSEVTRNGDVAFVSSQPERSAGQLVLDLQRRGLLEAGAVLVQNPFNPLSYFRIDDAEDQIGIRKSHLIVQLCQVLGASKVSVISARDEKHNLEMRVEAGLVVPRGSLKGEGNRKRLESFVASASIIDELTGSAAPDIETARDLLERAGLDDDIALHQLVVARAHPTNTLRKRTVKVNMTQEASRTIDAVIEARHLLAKAGGKFRSSEVRRTSVTFTYEIEFGADVS